MTKLGEIEVLRLLPKHVFQLVRCDPPKWIPKMPEGSSSSDPLVGDLSLAEGTDQRIEGRTRNDGSRAALRAVVRDSEWTWSNRPGA